LDYIEQASGPVDLMIGMQATSPIREPSDLEDALETMYQRGLDSLLSCVEIEDFFMWKADADGRPIGVNHDYTARKRRQVIEKRYLENGSFYVFKPALLRENNNRLAGKIGLHVMQKHKMFQIDNNDDIALCAAIMRGYGLDR
jgi:N-acylneuraminate cytidylyltransferase